jgi:hypothetical protein
LNNFWKGSWDRRIAAGQAGSPVGNVAINHPISKNALLDIAGLTEMVRRELETSEDEGRSSFQKYQ